MTPIAQPGPRLLGSDLHDVRTAMQRIAIPSRSGRPVIKSVRDFVRRRDQYARSDPCRA